MYAKATILAFSQGLQNEQKTYKMCAFHILSVTYVRNIFCFAENLWSCTQTTLEMCSETRADLHV